MPCAGEEGQSALEEGGRRHGALVGELLGVGQPRRVVDGHVRVVPADAAVAVLRAQPPKRLPPPAPMRPSFLVSRWTRSPACGQQ